MPAGTLLVASPTVLLFMRRFFLALVFSSASLAHEPKHPQSGPPSSPPESARSVSFESWWESRYVSEGTDNLDGAGILSELLTVQWGNFHTHIWQGIGYDTNFAELNLVGVFDFQVGATELYLSFNHKRYFHSASYGNELGTGFVYAELPGACFIALDLAYSFDADGLYAEASFGREWDWDVLSLRPVLGIGCNANYLAAAQDGFHSLMPRLDVSVPLNKNFSLLAYAAYNLALNDSADSFFWGGVGVKVVF